jgi:hypothetical protein
MKRTVRVTMKQLLLSLMLLSSAFGSSYHVTQSGAGGRDGTDASSALALNDFNKNTKLTGGDTVVFSGTFSSPVTPAASGTADKPLVLDFRGATLSAGLTMDGRSNVSVRGGTGTISISNGSNITQDGWTYSGPAGGTATFAYIQNSNHVTISNAKVTNVAYGFLGDINHFINIIGCDVLTSTNETNQTDIVHFGSATDVVIEKCKLVQRAPGNTSVRHNDVIQTYRSGSSAGFASANWTLRYNWIELQNTSGSGDASWLMIEAMNGTPALKIYGNVFVGSGTAGNNGLCISRNGGGTYYLYNNTVIRHKNPDNTIRYLDSGTAYWKNNVGMADAGVSGTYTNITMTQGGVDYNFWYRFGSNYAGSHGSTKTDPLFTNYAGNDFSLTANSPLRGAGVDLGSEYAQGIAPGATWPNPTLAQRTQWDVGAYVGAPGPPPSPTPTPTPVPPKFSINDTVTPTATVNTRATPAGTVLGTHDAPDIGTVIDGPEIANLNGAPVTWYSINWSTAPDGWVGDDNLVAAAAPSPTPSPNPTATPNPSATPGPTATPTPPATYEDWIKKQNDWIRQNPPTPDQIKKGAN